LKHDEEKLYYSISEVAEMTDVKPYVLRFWEKEFPLLRPKKNRGGNRTYQKREIALVNRIKNLLYEQGYTIEGARQKLSDTVGEVRRDDKMVELLGQVKRELMELERLFSNSKDDGVR
jgi:DNA-binding transcriptional MerR regulator